ncbi:MAG: lytic transglycosylase domain-containing protein [Syntrophomonadaceae bacterium]|nr:lytic transglycosylase domain-containing protein [Syntrophomonadaceae bacterium]
MSNIFSDMFTRITMARLMEVLAALSPTRAAELQGASLQDKTASSAGSRPFSEIIKEASEKYGVDENIIQAVIQQESSFNARAVSSCGAQGLMQLMPATARALGVNDPFDAEQNILAGTKYLREKLDEFGGNLSLALAAYNAGSGAVRKYAGIPPYQETQNYVAKIMKSIDYQA